MHGGRGQGRKKGGSWRHQELEAQRSWLDRRDRTERPEALESKRARPNSLCGDTLSCRQLISNHLKVDLDRSEAALLGVSCSVGVPVQEMGGPAIRLGTSFSGRQTLRKSDVATCNQPVQREQRCQDRGEQCKA